MEDSCSRARDPDAALGIVDHLRRRSARCKLTVHLLDLRCLLIETRSKLRNGRLLLWKMEL